MRIRALTFLFMASLLTGCAASIPKSTLEFPGRDGIAVKPSGDGPFPAVILLPTCAGVGGHLFTWQNKLRALGYVTMIVDNFTARGVRTNCGLWAVSVDQTVGDALAAQAYLRTLPFVDGGRIGVIGFSWGASVGLRMASAGYMKGAGAPDAGFQAIISVYALCTPGKYGPAAFERSNNLLDDVSTPLLILIGGADDETDPIQCEAKARSLQAKGQPVSYKVYPGVTHAFDQVGAGSGTRVRGFLYRYDEAATLDAGEQMKLFFGRHLKGEPIN